MTAHCPTHAACAPTIHKSAAWDCLKGLNFLLPVAH